MESASTEGALAALVASQGLCDSTAGRPDDRTWTTGRANRFRPGRSPGPHRTGRIALSRLALAASPGMHRSCCFVVLLSYLPLHGSSYSVAKLERLGSLRLAQFSRALARPCCPDLDANDSPNN